MLRGTLTLLNRSLRESARKRGAHAVRLISVLVLLGMLIEAHVSSGGVGAPGLRLFHSVCYLSVALISLAGLGFFASAIAEEKEEGTLGLLKMADLSSLSIVLGKSTSRLAIALVVFIGQLPFALLSITLGGLKVEQVWAAYVAIAAYLVLVANIALLYSVMCRKTSTASILLLLTLLSGLFIAPLLHDSRAGLVRDELVPQKSAAMDVVWGASEFFADNSILRRIDRILTTGFKESAFSAQVWTSLAGAFAFFVVACLVFDRFTEYVGAPGGGSSGWLARWSDRRVRGRVWRWPLVWKDFYFLAGGPLFIGVKTVFYLGLIATMIWQYDWVWVVYGVSLPEAAWSSAIIIAIAESLLYAARFYHVERTEGTLPTLLVLPSNLVKISYGKLAGCLLGSLPTVLMFAALVVFVPGPSLREETVFQQIVPGCMLLLVLVHLTVLYSLIVRWGALPLAAGTLLLGGSCIVPIVAAAVATIYTSGQGVGSAFGPVLYTGIVLSGALQVAIGVRLRVVAAQ
jgi:hypothetical protein